MTGLTTINPAITARKIPQYYGQTPIFACQSDKRFSYCLYVPRTHETAPPPEGYPLVVAIHGTDRNVERFRAAFIAFAKEHQCIILCPIFPAGVSRPLDLDEYKRIAHAGVRYDDVLLSMVEEISAAYSVRDNGRQFMLHGYSGGGQFAHRFFYLHPDRVSALSVGAPGMVTPLDPSQPWWVGTADVEQVFGIALDLDAIAAVPVLLTIGELDDVPDAIKITETEPAWMAGINDSGTNRRSRLETLAQSLRDVGVQVQFETVPGIGHHSLHTLPPVIDFFAQQMSAQTAAQPSSSSASC